MNKCVGCETYSKIKNYNADFNKKLNHKSIIGASIMQDVYVGEILFYSRGGYGRIPLNYCPTCGKSLHDDENKNAGDRNE